jgi:hypothetical protein
MSKNKGKPSGTYAEEKTSPGKKGNYQRFGWPEDVPTQEVESGKNQQQGKKRPIEKQNQNRLGRGRNKPPAPPSK